MIKTLWRGLLHYGKHYIKFELYYTKQPSNRYIGYFGHYEAEKLQNLISDINTVEIAKCVQSILMFVVCTDILKLNTAYKSCMRILWYNIFFCIFWKKLNKTFTIWIIREYLENTHQVIADYLTTEFYRLSYSPTFYPRYTIFSVKIGETSDRLNTFEVEFQISRCKAL